MKNLITCIAFLITSFLFSQSGINYKAVIKDGSGNILANQTIDIQFIIYEGAALDNNVYQESHTTITDAFGIITVNIGVGTQQGRVFTDVDWNEAEHFLNVQIDKGSGLVDMGTTQFMAVPYALHAVNVTGLEALDEGNGIGWRLLSRNSTNYDPVGFNAIDFSFVDNPTLGLGATGNYAFSLGHNGSASGEHSFAFGNQNYSLNGYAIAMGNNNIVSGLNSTAIGAINQVSGDYAFAAGLQNEASENYTFAMGQSTTASGVNSTAFGRNTEAIGESAVAMGSGTEALGNFSFAFGDGSEAQGHNSIAMGDDAFATSNYAVAIGRDAIASGESSFAVGNNTDATGYASTAMGTNTEASGSNSTAMGSNTQATSTSATAMGLDTRASGLQSTAMGRETLASGFASTAMGNGSIASGSGSFALGQEAMAQGAQSIAMGTNAATSVFYGVAIGRNTNASAVNAMALGTNTQATRTFATAIGLNTMASGYASIAIGNGSHASGTDALALGLNTNASANNATAMGVNTIASGFASTAIGLYNIGGANALFEVGNGISTNRANAFTVRRNGNVGIGTHDPQELLHIDGGRLRIGTETIEDTGTNRLSFNADLLPDSDNSFRLGNSTTRWTSVWAADGSINTSDRREKENITEINYGLKEIQKLIPVSFNWKKRPEAGVKLGLIAQDLQTIIPEVVLSEEIIYSEDDPTSFEKKSLDRLGVYYSDLIPVLIKAIQEQQDIISLQKAELTSQSSEIGALSEENKSQSSKIETLSGEINEIQQLTQRINLLENNYKKDQK